MILDINSPIVDRGVAALQGRVMGEDQEIREVVHDLLQATLEPEPGEPLVHRAFFDLVIRERDYEHQPPKDSGDMPLRNLLEAIELDQDAIPEYLFVLCGSWPGRVA